MAMSGCQKEDVRVYNVSKEPAQAQASPARWKIPAGWKEQPASGMRVGSFQVAGANGEAADVSIIPLGGAAGSDLDNINRWRGQIGLTPVTAEGLDGLQQKLTIDGVPAILVDLEGVDAAKNQPTRIVAAIARVGESNWFFKMIGAEALVAAQKASFVEFIQSFVFPSGEATALVGAPSTVPPVMPPPPVGGSGSPKWEAPSSWVAQTPSSMIIAKFGVDGGDLGAAEATVSAFPGDVGGLLMNVNRWRAQLGLSPVSAGELASVTKSIVVGGAQSTLVDMANPSGGDRSAAKRILVALVPHMGKTWFFKLLGSEALIEREQPGFMKFLQSIQLPNDA
jgi:hypothetical protein